MKKQIKKVLSGFLVIAVLVTTVVTVKATQSRYWNYNTNYTLTGNGATDMVNVAVAQLGRSGSSLGYSEAWCADFVGDCAILAGVSSQVPLHGGVSYLKDAIVNAGGRQVYDRQPGDILFYYCNSCGCYVHVGIVLDGTYSIEGNVNSQVYKVGGQYNYYIDASGHSVNDVISCVYIRPNYTLFANIGEDFYATFLNKAFWKPISVKRGNGVTIETEDGKSTQKWRFTRQSDGAYVIRSCYNGKCLEMTDGIRENSGIQVTAQNDFWGGNYQQWYVIPYGTDNSYIIQNKHYYDENWVLDLSNIDPSDGNDIIIYQRNNSDAQIWSIYSADDVQLKPTTLTATVNSPDVTFTWDEVFGESSYDVKIWKGEAWDGDPYKVIWNTESGCTVELPAGTYSAYVDACDYFQCFMSNVVTFTVEEPEKVSGYYTYEVDENGNATIIRCDPSISGDITVPQTLDGYPVTKIGSAAFQGCKNITGITVLENVTSMGMAVFDECVSLKYANIMADGNTLNPFYHNYVFRKCSNLETVYLHNTNLASYDMFYVNFHDCYKLMKIEFAPENPYFKTVDGVVYSKDGSTLWYVPNGITDEAYYVPETVTEIADGAFCDCINIKDIYIYGAETVISRKYQMNIGYKTKYFNTNVWTGYTEKLDYVTIHAKSDSLAKEYADKHGINFVELTENPTTDLSLFTYEISNGEVTLLSCNSEAKGEIIIPSEIEGCPVTVIGDYCFYNCSQISNLVIPDTVTTIGSYAFGCEYDFDSEETFEAVFIPASVTSIGYNAFYECDSLKEIIVSGDNLCYSSDEYGVLFNKDKTELICYPKDCEQKNYEIPNTVQRLSACAFQGANVEYISIPESVSEIATDSFFTNLKGISVDSNNSYFSSDDCGVLFNKDKTKLIRYPALSDRTGYKVPESVVELEICAFDDSQNLVSIELPDNIEEIGYCTFNGCVNLKNITLPKNLKVIGEYAFQNCKNLENFVIPYGVEKLGYYTFRWSENIEYVHITEDTTSIGENILDEIEGNVYICSDTEDCYAKEYAEQYGYEFRICDGHGLTKPGEPDKPDLPDNPDVPDEPDTPTFLSGLILTPSQTTVRYGDSIILHVDAATVPQGGYVVWEASNDNFEIIEVSDDGLTCTITPKSSGDTTFTANVYNADGKTVCSDVQDMTSKASIWDKIIAFFKTIFGLSKTIPQVFRGVF
ncbi:MAG: leucine-rich repeat protein [Clostridia bacterium]|nr:leucine-rich repeat protein [Clostridia bacterium]